ncbi:hypothetical protein Halha_1940 [Halobacteroides halobius DSM 5150]|uniref:Uncharacterized protein n=1 Tax=Halobacteroides halobius (strain ATCC 35273 / DSM 5150 / MD-1) TaxID=748449 RepID=L0KBW4_HALHC|nr:hypothetical protein [Halobacteroides halobius]AGB41849.1 hypothetical protein Halha_1940 [Halobacteroides halobius DSM 5150]
MKELSKMQLRDINGGELSDVNWTSYIGGGCAIAAGVSTGNVAAVAIGMATVIDACDI